MGVQTIDQAIFPLTSGNRTLWSFPIPLEKYFDLLPTLPLNNCILFHYYIIQTDFNTSKHKTTNVTFQGK
jgi:hypothetical protein